MTREQRIPFKVFAGIKEETTQWYAAEVDGEGS